MTKNKYNDLPIKELIELAKPFIESGHLIFFKFTCEKCGSRQTFDRPNIMYLYGKCEECGHITKVRKGGFLLVMVM